jgi:hypothetical protein
MNYRPTVAGLRLWGAIVFAAGWLLAQPPSDWNKVMELATGSELRIYRNGSKKPLEAKMGEASGDKLVILLKNEQTGIDRDEIDRIEWRSGKPSVRREATSSTDTGKVPGSGVPDLPGRTISGPSGSRSSSLTFGGKGKFEVIYTRPKVGSGTQPR